MKIKFWILAATLAATVVAQAATNDLTGLLQKGLFDEEANRDLNAAIADYQSVASAFDKDRQLAATAIFRLGECYRKLGKSSEAAIQYQRIIKEFGDQPTLVTLSRQNLAGMGVAGTSVASNGFSGVAEEVRQQIEQARVQLAKDQSMLQTLQNMDSEKLRQTLPQLIPDTQLDALQMRLNQAEQDLIKLKLNYTPDHPEYKNAEEVVADLKNSINERIDGILNGVAARRESEETYLSQLTAQLNQESKNSGQSNQSVASATAQLESDEKRLQELLTRYTAEHPLVVEAKQKIESDQKALTQAKLLAARPAESSEGAAPVTDEEQQEIRRIQLIIQNSPDLINAPGQGVNGDETPLAMAAAKGQLVVAKYLLDHGADVNGWSRQHTQTPLFNAAEYGHKAMAELLLSHGADVSGGKLNPLYVAASRGYVSVAEVLIANKADVNLPSGTDTSGMRPVHVAARDGRTEMLQLLINRGADVNVTNVQGDSPLEFAAEQNEMAAAKMLLAAKANVAAKDKDGNTALHVAARSGHAEMVTLLLDSGAAVDSVNGMMNATPLLMAVAGGRVDATRVLLEHKADPNHRGWSHTERDNQNHNWQPITFALSLANNDLVKLLLDAGANPEGDSVDPHEASPLFFAINGNYVDGVRMLLEHGANPNRAREGGVLPLELAVRTLPQDKPMIPMLLEKGADPNPTNAWHAPIFLTSDSEVGRWLVEHKADVNIRRTDGFTPLMMAAANNYTNFLEFLLGNGAKTDLQDVNGNTALHFTVYNSRPDSVAILLAHKANPNIQNNNGYTALDLAKEGMDGHILGSHLYPNPNINESRSPAKDVQSNIADELMAAGGLANLPKHDRIEVRRASRSGVVIYKDSHNRNHYSLLETIATTYGLLSQEPSGAWQTRTGHRAQVWGGFGFSFPDLKRVIIYRRTGTQTKPAATTVDVESILNSGDCSQDVRLEWGDVVEIPEADHPVGETWQGFSEKNANALVKCISRQATVDIKGEGVPLKIGPILNVTYPSGLDITGASFMLRSVLDNSKLIRVSSDLSRVKVIREDPDTRKKVEWVIDCTDPKQSDLWVRDGDVIEVPER